MGRGRVNVICKTNQERNNCNKVSEQGEKQDKFASNQVNANNSLI